MQKKQAQCPYQQDCKEINSGCQFRHNYKQTQINEEELKHDNRSQLNKRGGFKNQKDFPPQDAIFN